MAERRPLVLVNGELQELPSGDTLPGAGSGLQNNLVATAAPTVTDDSNAGYAVGSRWVDVTNDNTYTCVDASVGAAVWVQENGAGGGASAFTGLSDTPANFTGQALKGLRVNAGETALEYTELGGSQVLTNIFIQDVNSETGYGAAVSATAAATKGNVVRTQFTVDLKTVQFQGNEATSETYEAVVAEISGTTIGTVLGRATATSTGGTDENIDITFSTPIRMVPNQDYVILITQQGGTGTTALDSSAGGGALTGIISSYALGGYVTDNNIQGGEIFQFFGTSYVGMSLTYDVVYNANGIGSGILSGAVDPTTEGNDGDWYINTTSNTIFGPKASGTWSAGVSLVGPTGATGADGNVDAYYGASLSTTLGSTLGTSTSTFATKGNRLIVSNPGRIDSLTFNIEAGGVGGAYEIVIGKLSDMTSGATLSDVYKQAVTPAAVTETHTLTTPYNVVPGDIIFFGLTKTDIAAAADPLIRFWSTDVDDTASPFLLYDNATSRSLRFTDNDIQNGDSPTDLAGSWWAIDIGFQPINALLPAGGTAGQILAKIDGAAYNTEWTDNPALMTQTEITATSYSTVNGDFAGGVIRRMNNAAAQTITVEPSMTGGQPVTFIATGAGAVSFAAGVGVTIHSAGGNLTIADQYGSATLIPDATTADTYYLIGNLTT